MSRSVSSAGANDALEDASRDFSIVVIGQAPFPDGFSKKDADPLPEEEETVPNRPPSILKRKGSHHVTVPTFHEVEVPPSYKKRVKWSRPERPASSSKASTKSNGVAELANINVPPGYDADDEDEAYFKKKVKPTSTKTVEWTLELFEKAMEFLEKELRMVEIQTELDRDEINFRCKNAATVAKAEHLTSAVASKRAGSGPLTSDRSGRIVNGDQLEAELKIVGEDAFRDEARGLEYGTRKSKRKIDELVPIVTLAEDLSIPEHNPGLKLVYEYWIQKRLREGAPLVNVAFLNPTEESLWSNDHPHVIASVFRRLKELREDLERARLLADSVRKREKIKKELVKLDDTGDS